MLDSRFSILDEHRASRQFRLVGQVRNAEIIKPDPVLGIGRTVVALYADLVIARCRQLTCSCRLKLAFGIRTELGNEITARDN